MASHSQLTNGLQPLAEALSLFLQEVEGDRSICKKHLATVAIHSKRRATQSERRTLEVYRMFDRDEEIAARIRKGAGQLPSWDRSIFWKSDRSSWEKMEREINTRMKKHSKQHPIISRGIYFEGRPIFIHAYKFEPDPRMKVELVLPPIDRETQELPLKTIATALRCHEFLVPQIEKALPFYSGHEDKFQTIPEYLSTAMNPDLYSAYCGFQMPKSNNLVSV